MKKENAKTILKNIPIFFMLGMLAAFAVSFIVLPKKDFSETENRMLASFPEISAKKILAGDFQKEFETYLSDRFPLRDTLLSVSVRADRLSGKQEINDVIYMKGNNTADGNAEIRLLDSYQRPENTKKFVDSVNTFSGKLNRADTVVIVVPTAISLYEEKLPTLVKMQNRPLQKDTLEYFEKEFSSSENASLHYAEGVFDTLMQGMEAGEDLYYRTDHHWKVRGAYRGYTLLAPYLEIPVIEKSASDFAVVSEDFYGTTWSKVCDRAVSPDTIEIYDNPDWSGNLKVSYEDTKETMDSPYNKEYLSKKDQYSMFLNNQHSLIRIENPNADMTRTDEENHSSLVIIKDSYANSLVPFLIDQYETIWVFDPRYYKGSISSWINEHEEVEDVLILYNLGTMDDDRGIGAIY